MVFGLFEFRLGFHLACNIAIVEIPFIVYASEFCTYYANSLFPF
jgi:hypothetical protein